MIRFRINGSHSKQGDLSGNSPVFIYFDLCPGRLISSAGSSRVQEFHTSEIFVQSFVGMAEHGDHRPAFERGIAESGIIAPVNVIQVTVGYECLYRTERHNILRRRRRDHVAVAAYVIQGCIRKLPSDHLGISLIVAEMYHNIRPVAPNGFKHQCSGGVGVGKNGCPNYRSHSCGFSTKPSFLYTFLRVFLAVYDAF